MKIVKNFNIRQNVTKILSVLSHHDHNFFKSRKRTTFGFSGLGPHISPTRVAKLQNAITTQKDVIKENARASRYHQSY